VRRALGRVGALRPLRHRDFALMWAGLATSLLGDGIYLVAIAWQAYELSDSPLALSAVGVAWTLPMVLFLLAGGIISDRRDRRRLMVTADLLRAGVVAVAAVLSLSGAIELWHLVALVAIYGVGDALFLPSATAIVPSLVPRDEVVLANALEQLARPLTLRFGGPALGGLIVALGGPGLGFALDAVTFLVSAACVAAMRPAPAPGAVGSANRAARAAMRELREGLSYVRSQAWLWATLGAAALALLAFQGPLEVLVPYRIKHELGLGAATFGAVLAAGGLGRVVGALTIGQRGLPRRHVTVMYLSWALATAAIAGYAVANERWQLMAIAAVAGLLEGTGAIVWGTLMQTRVPRHLLGRVSSLDWMVSTALIPLSFALAGPLGEAFGAQAVLLGAGAAGLVFGLAFLLVPGVRDPERTPLPSI
jgi:DHA3 family tetracycline resistance protein-like MFS transporter